MPAMPPRPTCSYARFLDARKAWGSVTNRSRDLARQGLAYLPPSQPELAAMLCRWIVAFRCGRGAGLGAIQGVICGRCNWLAVRALRRLPVVSSHHSSAELKVQHCPSYAATP